MATMTTGIKTTMGIIVSVIVVGGAIAGWTNAGAVKAQVDKTQDDRIFRTEADLENVKTDVSAIKIKAAEEFAIKKAIFDTLNRMEASQVAMVDDIGVVKIDVATTKVQVDNLERKE